MIATFSTRLGSLSEPMRYDVLEAHLMSVEDIDIYNNEILQKLLNDNDDLFHLLAHELEKDGRFYTNN